MLSRIPIAFRIYAGFGLVGALAVILGLAAIFAANRARDNTQRFRELHQRTFAILELQTEVTDLQRSVQLFSSLGHESLAEEARRRISGLRERFESAESLISDDDAERLLDRMRTSLDNYEQSLETAVAERRLRYELVHVELPKLDQRLDTLSSAPVDTDPVRWNRFVDAGQRLQGNVYRYLYEPDYALLTEALSGIESLAEAAVGPDERAHIAVLEDYGKVFTRIVQATRGTLYLVGVVMAGEAWEFSHLSRTLTKQVLADVPSIVESMEFLASSIQRRTLTGGALALLGALGLSWWIGRSISGPLREVSQTLDGLARGERVDEIPGIDRRDEVGVMASAANAFKQANDRTQSLLVETREMATELESNRVALERSNRELEQFVYTVSHDLKTPLVTSLGFIGMMREMADSGDKDLALSKLEVLERSNRRMSQLIAGLLDLSRVGRLDTEREDLDPTPVIEATLDQLSGRLTAAGCTVRISPALPRIRVNATRFAQVIDNLVTNALKYGQPIEGPCEILIAASSSPEGRVVLTVTDHGQGIAPEHHDRVFGLFNRLSTGGEGTGIGLAIVERVMQTSGGSVRVVSQGTGDGCSFELEFERGHTDG